MLLAAAPFALLGTRPIVDSFETPIGRAGRYPAMIAVGAIAALILIGLVGRMLFGNAYAYRPLTAETIIDLSVRIDRTLPDITCDPEPAGKPLDVGDFRVEPRRIRMRVVASNYHSPVKYYGLASGDSGTA